MISNSFDSILRARATGPCFILMLTALVGAALTTSSAAEPATLSAVGASRAMPAVASGRPEFFVQVVDDVSSPEALDTKHGIKPVRVPDLRALTDAAVKSGRSVQLCYDAVRENANLAQCVRLAVKPLGEAMPSTLNPDDYVNLDALQEAIDKREAAVRHFTRLQAAYLKSSADEREDFAHRAIVLVQGGAASARDAAAQRGSGTFQASDIAGALTAAAERSQATLPIVASILLINSDLEDIVSFRASRAHLTRAEFPRTITIVICVNTSFEPDRSPLLQGEGFELHHRNNLAAAVAFIGELLNR